jgi:phosphoserine phosphatase
VEGIDLLAGSKRAEVEALTAAAMRGDIPLEEVYGRRLDLIRPTRAQVEAVGNAYVAALVPAALEVVRGLHAQGIEVWIVSGGLMDPVLTVAAALGVPSARVAAVQVRFREDGSYAGFDPEQPLARAGGKPAVLAGWGAALSRPALMVGDGVTDLEAGEVVEDFLAFAGVVHRPGVTNAASLVVRAPSLEPVFSIAVGPPGPSGFRGRSERNRPAGRDGPDAAELAALYERGLRLGWEDRGG